MLKVRRKSWVELLFARARADDAEGAAVTTHSPLRLWVFLALCAAVAGIFNRVGIVISLSMAIYAVVVYWRTHALARSLVFRRSVPVHSTEREFIELNYEVMNTSAFPLSHYFLVDRFSGTKLSRVFLDGGTEIKAASARSYKVRRKCDAGMGIKEFGPLIAVVTDPLGLFEFQVVDEAVGRIEIYPRLESIPQLPMIGSKDSFLFGLYDVRTRGGSVNFIGIRDYSPGDSLRHISWRLSAKYSKLLVKEFEKSVNTDVSIVMNMDGREHMGQHSESTWEFMKDIALALVTQQLQAGNGVQLLSNQVFLPMGRGATHAHEVSLKIFDMKPAIDRNELPPLRRFRELIPRGSTIIYLSPVFSPHMLSELDQLRVYRAEGSMVRCILLDASTFISGKLKWANRERVEGEIFRAKQQLKAAVHTLAAEEIPTHVVSLAESVGHELLKPPVGFKGGHP